MHVINSFIENISNSDVLLVSGVLAVSFIIFIYDKILAFLYLCLTGISYWFLFDQINYINGVIVSSVFNVNFWPKEVILFNQVYAIGYEDFVDLLSVAVIVIGCLIAIILMNAPSSYRIRGAQIVKAKARWLGWFRNELRVGNVVIPKNIQTRSISIEGDVGSGKSELIFGLIKYFRRNNHPGFCLDFGLEIVEKLYKNGDVILDCRQELINWSIFAEIMTKNDCYRVAAAFIPDVSGSNKEWIGYARTFLAAILMRLYNDNATNKVLIHYLNTLSIKQLAEELKGLGIDRIFDDSAEKMLASILGVLNLCTVSLGLLEPNAGKDSLSITKIVRKKNSQWIFALHDADTTEQHYILIRAWTMLVLNSVLGLSPDNNFRYVISIDEFPVLGHLTNIHKAVALGRKRGLVAIFGFQKRAQLREIYGNNITESILGCTGTRVILRVLEGNSAEEISKDIGDEEIINTQVTYSNGVKQRQPRKELRRVLLASEIQAMPDLEAVVNSADNKKWLQTPLKVISKKFKKIDLPLAVEESCDSLSANIDKDTNTDIKQSSFDEI